MHATRPTYDNPYQTLTEREMEWLNKPDLEGAKELVVEALEVAVDIVLPASSSLDIPRRAEFDQGAILRQYFAFYYNGTTFKQTMDTNVQTAIEIHNVWRQVGRNTELESAANASLQAARKQLQDLMINGRPDGMRPWRRVFEEPAC